MKNILKNIIASIAVIVAIGAATSCKKDNNTTTTSTPTGIISFHLHTNINFNEDSLLTNNQGFPIQDSIFTTVPSSKTYVNIQLDTAQLYISGIVFHNANGSSEAMTGQYILKYIAAEGPYIVGPVPTGTYTSVSFNVGLDTKANSTAPSSNLPTTSQQFPGVAGTTAGTSYNVFNPPATFTSSEGQSGPIAPMWSGNWSSTTGYYFLNVQGYADTSANQSGCSIGGAVTNQSSFVHFSFQLSTTPIAISLPAQTITNSGQTGVVVTTSNTFSSPAEMHLICDYGQLMKNITTFKPPYNTTANPATVAAIQNGVANMFHYEYY